MALYVGVHDWFEMLEFAVLEEINDMNLEINRINYCFPLNHCYENTLYIQDHPKIYLCIFSTDLY